MLGCLAVASVLFINPDSVTQIWGIIHIVHDELEAVKFNTQD